jgi:glutamate-1-semialdehyde 2,1-aminomutase
MAAMNVFLRRIEQPEYQRLYEQAETVWSQRIQLLNRRLKDAGVPVEIAHLHTVCTVLYKVPSRYNWMFQFYLRDQGLELSWVGSGRMILSLNFSDEEFAEVSERFIRAAQTMLENGWWWQSPELTSKSIQRQLFAEMLRARFPLLSKFKIPITGIRPETHPGETTS